MSTVLDKIKSVCMVHDVGFRDLQRAMKGSGVAGDLLEGKVDLVQTNPPYDVRNERSMDNSSHCIFTPEDKSDFEELARRVMATGTHTDMFYTHGWSFSNGI